MTRPSDFLSSHDARRSILSGPRNRCEVVLQIIGANFACILEVVHQIVLALSGLGYFMRYQIKIEDLSVGTVVIEPMCP